MMTEERGLALSLLLLTAGLTACGGGEQPTGERQIADQQAVAPRTDEVLMQEGMQLLHEEGRPFAAEPLFREVIARSPTHYGVHYQLAVALDRSARPTEARVLWTELLRMAESIRDEQTIETARSRLAAPDTASQAALMAKGVHLLYERNDPAGAIPEFRAVLQRNPEHYGATYQLATALDRSGGAAEAATIWVRVLEMAERYADEQTATTARQRLR
jgi:Flp pilus assembly protein TadD